MEYSHLVSRVLNYCKQSEAGGQNETFPNSIFLAFKTMAILLIQDTFE